MSRHSEIGEVSRDAGAIDERFPRVAIVIPMYKAEATIENVIATLPSWVDAVVVVDDASPDESAEVVRNLPDSRVHLVKHEVNQGVGGAVISGYAYCLRMNADIVVKMDADGQMPASDLPALLTPIIQGKADVTKGNRFTSRKALSSMPLVRKVGNAFLSFVSKWSSGYWNIFDPCNGYIALSRSALLAMDFDTLHRRYFFESSQLVSLALTRAVVRDVPMSSVYDGAKSHLSVVDSLFRFPFLHLRYGLRRWFKQYFLLDFSAASLYLAIGVPLLAAAVVRGATAWLRSVQTGDANPTGTVVLVAVMVIVGLQLVLQAVAFDMVRTPSVPLQSLRAIDFEGWYEVQEGASTEQASERWPGSGSSS